jgi:PleD family two-component response regulator
LADGLDAKSLMRRADEALYAAKDAGRDRVCLHEGRPSLQLGEAAA